MESAHGNSCVKSGCGSGVQGSAMTLKVEFRAKIENLTVRAKIYKRGGELFQLIYAGVKAMQGAAGAGWKRL